MGPEEILETTACGVLAHTILILIGFKTVERNWKPRAATSANGQALLQGRDAKKQASEEQNRKMTQNEVLLLEPIAM